MLDRFWHQFLRRPYKLHVEKYGAPNLPVVILLHGIGASGEDWKHFLPELTKHYHCISVDLLGCGRSPKPQWLGYFPEDHSKSLRATIRSLRLDNFILIGHSLGALLATSYASRYPLSIERLILLSPPVYPPVTRIRNHLARQRTGVLMAIYRALQKSFVTPELIGRLAFILPPAKYIKENSEGWLPAMRTLERCIEQQTVLEDIQKVAMPVDVWYGLLDEVVIGTNIQLLATHHPKTNIHTYGGRHLLTKQYAQAFCAWFLRDTTASR